MRYPRNTKIFRGQLDAAPFVTVFFLLVIFLLLHSTFVFLPGVPIRLPEATGLPGTERPTLSVVVDESGQFYYENQIADEKTLLAKLKAAVAKSKEPLTLVVQADEKVTAKLLVNLALLARNAGLRDMVQATRPKTIPTPRAAAP
jgi:biopolymer transport protein ExbD